MHQLVNKWNFEVVIFGAHRKKKKKTRWAVRVALLSEERSEFKVFVGKPEGKMSEGFKGRLKGKVYTGL